MKKMLLLATMLVMCVYSYAKVEYCELRIVTSIDIDGNFSIGGKVDMGAGPEIISSLKGFEDYNSPQNHIGILNYFGSKNWRVVGNCAKEDKIILDTAITTMVYLLEKEIGE